MKGYYKSKIRRARAIDFGPRLDQGPWHDPHHGFSRIYCLTRRTHEAPREPPGAPGPHCLYFEIEVD